MSILVTGATGTIGSQVLAHLQGKDVKVRALVRNASKERLLDAVTAVSGDMTDVDSMRATLGFRSAFKQEPRLFLTRHRYSKTYRA